jgi:hypothetical protein
MLVGESALTLTLTPHLQQLLRGSVLGGHLVARQLLQLRDVALQLRQLGRRLRAPRARLRPSRLSLSGGRRGTPSQELGMCSLDGLESHGCCKRAHCSRLL